MCMKIKKIVSLVAVSMMMVMGTTNVFAAEDTKFIEGEFVLADSAVIYGNARAVDMTLGEAELYVAVYNNANPKANAVTRTYNGKKYDLSARVGCIDMLDNSSSSGTATAKNATSVRSGLLTSPTIGCTFVGEHKIVDSATGATYRMGTRSSVS